MERRKAGMKKRSPDGLSHLNQNFNNYKHNNVVFDKICKKYNEIQLTKNKMNLNIIHPPPIDTT